MTAHKLIGAAVAVAVAAGCAMHGASETSAPEPAAGPARIAFPADYKNTFTRYASRDRVAKDQVVEAFANKSAVDSAKAGTTMDDGSVLVMEVYKAAVDDDGKAKKNADGRFEKGAMAAIVVMEKQKGWGASYPDAIRNGDWEYAKFKPTGDAADGDTKACFECHKPLDKTNFVFTFAELDKVKP